MGGIWKLPKSNLKGVGKNAGLWSDIASRNQTVTLSL
jgi:hypothetical protein